MVDKSWLCAATGSSDGSYTAPSPAYATTVDVPSLAELVHCSMDLMKLGTYAQTQG